MRAFCGPGRAAGRVALKLRAAGRPAVTNFGPRATLFPTRDFHEFNQDFCVLSGNLET